MAFEEHWDKERDEAVLKASLQKPGLFRILITRYEEAFLRKAKTVVHDEEESQDIVQETFVKIYRYGKNFEKREGIEFKSWAYKILMNTAFTHYSKLQKSKNNLEFQDFLAAGELHPEDNYMSRQELADSVQVALAKMPMPLATALKAYYFEDKSYEDIAKEQQITLPALKMRLFRAKRIFKKHFELDQGFISNK
jgi:RNA polymerase sigma factor (sigma-70 family)